MLPLPLSTDPTKYLTMTRITIALALAASLSACAGLDIRPASEAEKLRAWNDPCRTEMGGNPTKVCFDSERRRGPDTPVLALPSRQPGPQGAVD